MIRALALALTLLASSCFADGILNQPKWNYDEHLTDKQKIDQLEKKAAYEVQRKRNFTARGIHTYEPTTASLKIALPTTKSKCNERLKQLNRIYKHLSAEAHVWRSYEFSVISKHFDRLPR